MPRQKYGVIWNYFDALAKSDKLAICKLCKKTLSYKGTITNLKTHLKLKHKKLYHRYFDSSAGASGSESRKKMDADEESSDEDDSDNNSDTMELPTYSGLRNQICVVNSVKTLSPHEPPRKVALMTKPCPPKTLQVNKTIEIDKCLVKLIAYDLQPFTIVEDEGFNEFVHALNPDYDLPSKNTISSSLLPASYEERKTYLMNIVKENAESVCLTVECWSSRAMDQYMDVTAHFFSKDLEMKSVFLQCDLLDGSDSGPRTAQQLKTIVEAWGISDKIVFLVSDNASNMCGASHILDWKRFGCFERKLNLAVQNALDTTKETVEKVMKIVTYLKNNSVAKEILMTHQLSNQKVEEPRTVIEAIPTRWNSTYLMLERFYSLKEAIQATVATLDINLPIISIEDWTCIKQMCMVLKPFHEVSNVMSGENYLTASSAMVLTSNLMSICDSLSSKRDFKRPITDLLKKMKEGLIQELGDIQYNLNIALCTLLDPRYKDVAFPDILSLDQTKRHALMLLQGLHTDDNTSQKTDGDDDILSIWGEFDSKVTSSNAPKTAETKAREELDMYLKDSVLHRKLCPLTWWRTNKNVYPVLYKIFKTKCNIVVTSVPCERAYSKTGFILNDRRTRLTSSKLAHVMFLNFNKTN